MEEADALTWPPKIKKYHILKQVVKKNPNIYQYTYQTFSMLPMR